MHHKTLAAALQALEFTPTQVGRVLHPEGSRNTVYVTGRRVLMGASEPGPSELVLLAAGLGLQFTVDASGVRAERSG